MIWKATSDQTWMTPSAQQVPLEHASTEQERNGRLMSAARAAVAAAVAEEVAAPKSPRRPKIAQMILLRRMTCFLKRSRWKLERLHLSRPRLTSIIAGHILPLTATEKTMETTSRTGKGLLPAFLLGKKSSARSLPAIWKPAPAHRRRAAADSVVAAAGVMEIVATAATAGERSQVAGTLRVP